MNSNVQKRRPTQKVALTEKVLITMRDAFLNNQGLEKLDLFPIGIESVLMSYDFWEIIFFCFREANPMFHARQVEKNQ